MSENKAEGKPQEGNGNAVKEMPKAAEAPKPPKSFTCSTEGVNDIAQCINDVVLSKHVKSALFNALNEHLKPVF